MKDQLKEFALQVGLTFLQGCFCCSKNQTGAEAFSDLHKAIETLPKDEKIVLFFDELTMDGNP